MSDSSQLEPIRRWYARHRGVVTRGFLVALCPTLILLCWIDPVMIVHSRLRGDAYQPDATYVGFRITRDYGRTSPDVLLLGGSSMREAIPHNRDADSWLRVRCGRSIRPVDRPITAFGGLTFGGGPIGNYMSHAIASMIDKLRVERGTALLFANGGYATHNHAIVISAAPMPNARFPHDYDCNPLADTMRGPVPSVDDPYEGPASIETYTVFYKRDGSPRFGTVIARTPAGARVLCRVAAGDETMITFLTDGTVEPVGSHGHTKMAEDGLIHWKSTAS